MIDVVNDGRISKGSPDRVGNLWGNQRIIRRSKESSSTDSRIIWHDRVHGQEDLLEVESCEVEIDCSIIKVQERT